MTAGRIEITDQGLQILALKDEVEQLRAEIARLNAEREKDREVMENAGRTIDRANGTIKRYQERYLHGLQEGHPARSMDPAK